MNALIGYTGFVGGNLYKQYLFEHKYNSSNIRDIEGKIFDTVVCAGVPGTKWLANRYPSKDLQTIDKLLSSLYKITCKKFILISTVDVYSNPYNVNENTQLTYEGLHHYGRNRMLVEEFVRKNFHDYHVIRLPAIYGDGIKKNFIYDMLNNHCLEWTHEGSIFQFYYLKNLWRDIEIVIKNDIRMVNFNSMPLSAKEIALKCFNVDFSNITEKPAANYNVRSIYSELFSSNMDYMYDQSMVLDDLKEFIARYKKEK